MSRTYEQARRMNAPRAIALCQCFSGALEFQAGHWREAEAALRESIRLHRDIGAASGEALACQRLGVLLTERGQLEEGLAVLDDGVIAAERALLRAHCLARLYAALARNRLAANDAPAANQALELGLEMSERHGHCATCDALLLPAAVSVRVRQGAYAAAEEFYRRLELASQKYASRVWVAMALQSRAELAAARGQLDQAIQDYRQAYENFTAAGNALESARCLTALNALRHKRRAAGDVAAARAEQSQAQAIYARLDIFR
ncbi:MAG: hypothetical protein HY782_21840 [Chloroflexi bacterium]|nr:hypothetical protein [Chloroflexota bacterium]